MRTIEKGCYKVELIDDSKITIICKNKECSFDLQDCFFGKKIELSLPVEENMKNKNIAMFDLSPEEFERTGEYELNGFNTASIRIYTGQSRKTIYVLMLRSLSEHYHKMIHLNQKKENIFFTGNKLVVSLDFCIYSRWYKDVEISKVCLSIDNNHKIPLNIKLTENEGEYVTVREKIPLNSIISQETDINNQINIEIYTKDGIVTPYRIGYRNDTPMPKKYNFCPIHSKYYKGYAMYLRGTLNQKYVLMVRPMEQIERTIGFRIKESNLVSSFLYHVIGKFKSGNKGKRINLFYEKNTMKAEEGTFQLFEKCLALNTSRNYFIISDESPQWKELSGHKNVVRKYSWKYYLLLYTASNFIATEGPAHLNIIRSVNKYLRKTLLESHFVFLQHGIIYMKNLASSTFAVDMEAEPDVFVVASEKEAEVVSPMMGLPLNRFLVSGQPVFSTIEADHINSESPDVVTIMLTWKDWEEYMLSSFKNSTYYQFVCEIYNLIKERMHQSQIRIIPHPKVHDHLLQTSLKEFVWDKPISEALKDTKLMITDYSSICYNAFYQGAGVVFYQPDVEEYERRLGRLIPKEKEYIGYRAFNEDELKEILLSGINEGRIDLDIFRKKEFVDIYRTINKYHDGKNIDRIADYLRDNGYV